MPAAGAIFRARLHMLRHVVLGLREGGFFKFTVVLIFGVALVCSLFAAMAQAFRFLKAFPEFQSMLTPYLFAIYFLTMLLMLTFSNAIISFGALFRSRETEMLMSMPVHHPTLYAYKTGEALIFSSWAFLVLGGPLMAAYGLYGGGERLSLPFYFAALALMLPFIFIPASGGAFLGMLLTRYFPRRRAKVLALGFAALAAIGMLLAIRTGLFKYSASIDQEFVEELLDNFSFSQSAWVPSFWVSEGIQAAARRDWRTAGFNWALLASTAFFLWMLGDFAAEKLYASSYSRALGSTTRRIYRPGGILNWLTRQLARFAPYTARLAAKDARTFLRDPLQWSQVVIFFGLLFLYVANLRNLGYERAILAHVGNERWHNFVAFLNLAAAGLTLATMTTRFVFPMISMEGRRFWVLGLLPIRRSRILWGKYVFAATGSFLLIVPLTALSSHMLGTQPSLAGMHLLTALALCLGLPGIAAGLGAVFPNFKEDNPSKVVSGFGGTVCLIISIAFVGLLVLGVGLLCRQVAMAAEGVRAIRHPLTYATALAVIAALAAAILPMWAGCRAINKAEL